MTNGSKKPVAGAKAEKALEKGFAEVKTSPHENELLKRLKPPDAIDATPFIEINPVAHG